MGGPGSGRRPEGKGKTKGGMRSARGGVKGRYSSYNLKKAKRQELYGSFKGER